MTTQFNLVRAFASFTETWTPKLLASLNGQELKVVKVQGTFPWHHHEDVDELFFVWRGAITIETDPGGPVRLVQGEGTVVPRGVVHRVIAEQHAEVLLFEPTGVVNTGNVRDPHFTAPLATPVEDR